MIVWKACEKCKDQKKVVGQSGWYYLPDASGVKECSCHKSWREENLKLVRAKKNGIEEMKHFDPLKEYVGSPDLDKVNKLVKYVAKFRSFPHPLKDNPISASLYIYSKDIIGHADLLKWVAYQLSLQGWSVAVASMRTLMEGLTPTHMFEDDDVEKVKAYHQKMVDVEFLVITEAFLPNEQTFRTPYLDRFLIDRLERNHRPTIFLSSTVMTKVSDKGLYPSTTQEVVTREVKKAGGELVLTSGKEVELGNIFGDDE